jgi:hypothetical protein
MSQRAAEDALIRAYIACNIAKDALSNLPPEIVVAVEEPLDQFCRVVGGELRKLRPDAVLGDGS